MNSLNTLRPKNKVASLVSMLNSLNIDFQLLGVALAGDGEAGVEGFIIDSWHVAGRTCIR